MINAWLNEREFLHWSRAWLQVQSQQRRQSRGRRRVFPASRLTASKLRNIRGSPWLLWELQPPGRCMWRVVVSVLVSTGLEVQTTVKHEPETRSEHSQTQKPDLEVDAELQELEEWEASSLRSRHLEIQILWSPLLRCLCLGLLWFAAERVRVEERESSAAEPAAEAGRSGLGRSYRFTQE